MKLRVVYHVCTIGNWRAVVDEQLLLVQKSGLLQACTALYLSIVGEHAHTFEWPTEWSPECREKCHLEYVSRNTRLFERTALAILRRRCSEFEDDVWLYLHSKGVTKPDSQPVTHWRQFMQHFLVENWALCVHTLKCGYDTVGVQYRATPHPHYSGNFWWATSAYLRRISVVPIGPGYIEPELWLMRKSPRWWSLHNAPHDLYKYVYLPQYYKNRVLVPTYSCF